MTDWKTKLNGYCKCFTGGSNKVGLIPNNDVCNCNANELKFALQSTKPLRKLDIACILIKLGIFTYKECTAAINELIKSKISIKVMKMARHRLTSQGYHVFYNKERLIKAYDKEKI